jgi:hypothetical protein
MIVDLRPFRDIYCVAAKSTDVSIYVISPLISRLRHLRFLPVNNNDDPTIAEGGSHWYPELMVYN